MNDLEHLRSTLTSHADDVVDHPGAQAQARLASVRHRVRVTRNRRRAAVAGGAAAVLAVVGGIALLPGAERDAGPQPAATVVGVTPPAELSSLGFTYAFERGVEGSDGTAVLELAASDEPRLVTWATSGDDDTVSVERSDGDASVTYRDPDFTHWTQIPEGSSVTVRATVPDETAGEAGLAVYTLTDERPAGITKDGVTFRQQTADGVLVDAASGDPGENEITISGIGSGEGLAIPMFCTGGPRGSYLHVVDVDGEPVLSGPGCDDVLPVDPAALGGSSFGSRSGAAVSLQMYVTEGRNGPLVESDDLRLGLAAYSLETYGGTNGFTTPEFEHDGHRWARIDIQAGTAGDGTFLATAPDTGSAVLALAEADAGTGTVEMRFGDDPGAFNLNAGGGTWRLVSSGDTVTITSASPRSPDGALRVAFYERVD